MKRVVNIKNMLAAVAIFLVMFCAYTTGSVIDVLFDAKLKAVYDDGDFGGDTHIKGAAIGFRARLLS